MTRIEELRQEIEPLRQQLINHPMYKKIKSLKDVQTFMEYHVFAVWDFMSLLKSLQNSLTCVSIPWIPVGSPSTRFFINEIVVGEESDIDMNGKRISHYELYLEAMKEIGANPDNIVNFVNSVSQGKSIIESFEKTNVSDEIKEFVLKTFETVYSNKPYLQATVFTFGREDLIPDMFINIVKDLHNNFPKEVNTLKYYLERHIEVDSGEHNPLAIKMTQELCGNDQLKWLEVKKAVKQSLQARINLWNGIEKSLDFK